MPDNNAAAFDMNGPAGDLAKAAIWSLLIEKQNDTAIKINVWIIHKNLTFGELFPVFELILGPRPTA